MNHKTLYRLYSDEGLSIRTRSPKRRRACRYRAGRAEAGGMNDVWAMDFMSDRLFDDRPFRILTIVDRCTREALSTAPRTNFRAYQVVEELYRLARLPALLALRARAQLQFALGQPLFGKIAIPIQPGQVDPDPSRRPCRTQRGPTWSRPGWFRR